jgi:hypothetical protein
MREYAMIVLLFGLPFLFVCALETTAQTFTKTQDQRQFESFNKIRGDLHGFNDLALKQDTHAPHRRSGNNAVHDVLFWNWVYFDENVFNTEYVNQLRNERAFALIFDRSVFAFIHEQVVRVMKVLLTRHKLATCILILLFVCASCIVLRRNSGLAVAILLGGVCWLLVMISLAGWFRLPDRVAVPVLFSTTILLFVWLQANGGIAQSSRRSSRPVGIWSARTDAVFSREGASVLSLLLLMLVFCNYRMVAEAKASTVVGSTIVHQLPLELLERELKGKLLIAVPGDPFLDGMHQNPLLPLTEQSSWRQVVGGWPIFSPYFYLNLKKAAGVDSASDLWFLSFRNRDVVWRLGCERMREAAIDYMRVRYGAHAAFESVDDLGSPYYYLTSKYEMSEMSHDVNSYANSSITKQLIEKSKK